MAITAYVNSRDWKTGEPQVMLVEDGKVAYRGALRSFEAQETVDLGGQLLLPKFIDSHCHILPMGLMLQALSLADCGTPEAILDAVRDRDRELEVGDWLFAAYYDQTKFVDGKHLTRHELDAISDSRPILLRHVNGHASIANSEALRRAGVLSAETEDPKGGEFVRDADGVPNGVLLETAHETVTNSAPRSTLEQMVDAILKAGDVMAELGIGTATDMMTGRYDLRQELEAYRIASERGCEIRLRLCLQWREVFGPRAREFSDLVEAMNPEICKVWGIKIFADGAIGSATAAIHGDYEGQPGNQGMLIYGPEKLKEMVQIADRAGYPIAIHTIGDRSTDLVMDAFEATSDPKRHRIEHAMILSDAQIERMARLGSHCTMQPEFLYRFGHAYLRQLGADRRARLKRARSVLDAGIPLSFSSDRPIVPGDPRDGIRSAVSRPSGYDESENVTLVEAISGYTEMGAVANHDGGLVGSLGVGEFADFRTVPSLDQL
jgi:predicted amidohydrolase YtcJ